MSRLVVCALCALSLVVVPLAHVPQARGAASNVAISQIYAGGGNAGATFANDYVELLNRGAGTVSLAGWSVQYASAASTSWSAVPLSGSIRPGGYYLVKLGSGGTTGGALPSADATGTVNLAASGGKIALSRDATALTCGATAGSCAASSGGGLEDLVGYGGATDFEGSAADAPSNTTALLRASAGCTDADANATDFAVGDPAPRNSSSAAASCTTGTTPPAGSVTSSASVAVDVQPVLSVSLEKTSISFGNAFSGQTPAPVSERVTVVSNSANGYALSVHRSAFAPADLPLALAATPTASLVPIPIASELAVGGSTGATPAAGDVWSTSVGFASALPVVPPGHYTSTITFTVIGK
jgi:lamin tail-like protein